MVYHRILNIVPCVNLKKKKRIKMNQDFPGSPVIRTPPFKVEIDARGTDSTPGQGTNTQHAAWHS